MKKRYLYRYVWIFCILTLTAMRQNTPIAWAEGTLEPTPLTFLSKALQGHTSAVTNLAWSPDSQVLASAAGGFQSTDFNVLLWRKDAALLATLSGHTKPIHSLAWSPDGKYLASGDENQEIRLWQPDGKLAKVIDARAGIVFALAWSPDGTVLASGSIASPTQNTVQLWDTADGKLLKTLITAFSGGKFYNLGWSPDGKYLVGGASSYTEWLTDGTPVFSYESCASCTPAWGFAWSPDSKLWAFGNESGEVHIFSVDGKNLTARSANSNVDVLAWSPDSQLVAGGNVYFWSPDGKIVSRLTAGRATTNIVWSPDGTKLATSDGDLQWSEKNVQIWTRDGQRWAVLVGHTAPVGALAWSPDGKTLASGSLDQTIHLWNLAGS